MDLWNIFVAIYGVVTTAALVLTFREQRLKPSMTLFRILGGYGLCTIWPAVVAVMVIFYKPTLQDS